MKINCISQNLKKFNSISAPKKISSSGNGTSSCSKNAFMYSSYPSSFSAYRFSYQPIFKGGNFITRNPIYNESNYFAKKVIVDKLLIENLQKLENSSGIKLFKSKNICLKLIDGLRPDIPEVKNLQLIALKKLVNNPKFDNSEDIIKLVSQINRVDRGEMFLSYINKLSKKYPNITSKELVKFVTRLEPKFLAIQEQFIEHIYMKSIKKGEKVSIDKFSEILSTVNDSSIPFLQLKFFKSLTSHKGIPSQIAMDLITNIDNKVVGNLKMKTSFILMRKGLDAKDLPILIPKIKNKTIAELNTKMIDYFISDRKMNSEIAAKIMSNIPSAAVFNLHKDVLRAMDKVRKFDVLDTLKVLGDIQTPDVADLKIAVINELGKVKKLSGHDIMHIVTNVDNVYSAEVKVRTAKKLSDIDKLDGTNIGYIVAGCHNEETSAVKCRASQELSRINEISGKAITTIASRLLKEETANIQISATKELLRDTDFKPEEISQIVKGMRNIDFKNAKINALAELRQLDKLDSLSIVKILDKFNGESKDKYLLNCIKKMSRDDNFTKEDITKIATTMVINKHNCDEYIKYFSTIPANIKKEITDYSVVQDFYKFRDKHYLNRFERRDLVLALVKNNASLFEGNENNAVAKLYPFLPTNTDEYCELLPLMSKTIYKIPSIISSPEAQKAIKDYPKNLEELYRPDSEFMKFDLEDKKNIPSLKYKRLDFIRDIDEITKDFSPVEKQKLTDQFGFLLYPIENKLSIKGYPIIPDEDLMIPEDEKLRKATILIAEKVKQFTEENSIEMNVSTALKSSINKLFRAVPELNTLVERKQNAWHHFDTFTHVLRVLQEVAKNEKFQKLSDNDKNLLATCALLHDISKEEFVVDKGHALTGAMDAYNISSRLNFTEDERNRMYAIIRNHEWLKYYNKEGASELQKIERAKNVAFTLREGNAFDLVSILGEADLRGLQRNAASYNLFKEPLKEGMSEISRYVRDLQRTAIPLPQNILPKASTLVSDGEIIRDANIGGIKNKVIYLYKNMGKGSLSFNPELDPKDFNVLVHALDSEKKSLIFQCMDEVDSSTLLSASFVNLIKGNWKAFRQQGFILNVDSDNIHAAYFKDFGSGLSKNIDRLKLDYLFDGYFKPQRDYISKQIKEKLHISDDSYKTLYQAIKNKSLSEIREDYPFVSSAIKQIYMQMYGGEYTFGRNYNEVLVTRPKIQGVFAYDRSITQVPKYLRQYAQDSDIPVIIFMDE